MKKQIILLVITAISFNINAQNSWGSKKIRGNGNVITKTRIIKNFDEISIGGSFDVNLIDGTEGKVTIEGEENIIPFIETTVKNGKLKVQFKQNTNIKTSKRLIITIPFEEINGISLGGSGDIISKKRITTNKASFSIGGSGTMSVDVAVTDLKTSIGGSGNINLKGSSDNFKCSIAGSGSIKSYGLQVNNIKASIAGSGSIQTSVRSKIKASIVGSGSLYYKGDPKYVDVKSVGSGSAINKN